MVEAEFLGVELQPIRCRQSIAGGVELVADNGMPKRQHVHAQLVGPPGQWMEAHPGDTVLAGFDAPLGPAGSAALVVHALARLVLPIGCERQVHEAGIFRHVTPYPSHV